MSIHQRVKLNEEIPSPGLQRVATPQETRPTPKAHRTATAPIIENPTPALARHKQTRGRMKASNNSGEQYKSGGKQTCRTKTYNSSTRREQNNDDKNRRHNRTNAIHRANPNRMIATTGMSGRSNHIAASTTKRFPTASPTTTGTQPPRVP